ncbi:hypothetical protein CUMW_066150 [Citrus unshiu]|nr:hypothetical protein CUMW_066150 [Citrus unshiu]
MDNKGEINQSQMDPKLVQGCSYRHVHVVEILSRKDPDYPYSAKNYGKMPPYMAAEKGCLEMVDVLLSTYTFMSHGSPSGKTALHAAARE